MGRQRGSLSPNREAFERDGYLFPIRLMPPREMVEVRHGLEDYLRKSKQNPHDDLLLQYKVHMVFTWADRLIREPALLDVVEALIGPNLLVWNTAVMMKKPGQPGFVTWHQDALYWANDPAHVVTAWVALTESDAGNGCLRMFRGSHRRGVIAHVDTFGEDNMLSRGQKVVEELEESDATDIVLRPGEASVHHTVTVHGSEPNRSERPRIGFAITYVVPEATLSGPRTGATLVRGVNTHDHFDIETTRPSADLEPAAIAAHDEAMRPFAAAIYEGAEQEGRISVDRSQGSDRRRSRRRRASVPKSSPGRAGSERVPGS